MAAAHPDTFQVPDPELLDTLRPGDLVKICIEFDPDLKLSDYVSEHRPQWEASVGHRRTDGERFWVAIQELGKSAGQVQ